MQESIWVLVEHDGREIEEVTFEILSEARRLADRANYRLTAILLGNEIGHLCDSIVDYYADDIYLVKHHLLEYYTTDGYTQVLTNLVRQKDPWLLLLGATSLGRDLASRLATRLNTSLVSDCVILKINDQGFLEMTRPTYGGLVYATITAPSARPQIATVRPGVIGKESPKGGNRAEVERIDANLKPESIRTRVLEHTRADPETLDISEADIVVACGAGLGDGINLSKVAELARLTGGSLGGSRPAIDAGWMSFSRQIGQTGKSIAPKIIICCGISGAPQFTMGMKDSHLIIAINSDRQAPIFKIADISVLGDMNILVPSLTKELRTIKENSLS